MFTFPIQTRYAETAQDGIIHHSSYIIYYETARIAYLASKGFDIIAMEKQSVLCPVVTIEAQYLKPLRSLEEVTLRVVVCSASKVKFKILHEIYKNEEKVAYAISTHCFINEAFKPIAIPKALFDAFQMDLKILSSPSF